jgi:hypothetical protein
MRVFWRPLAVAAALSVACGVGRASAQTVIVANSKPAASIQLVFNLATVGSASTDKTGKATLPVKRSGTAETDVHVFVDACQALTRVLLLERGLLPEAVAAECERREIPGWYLVRSSTTLVVDLRGTEPKVWVTQGSAPEAWLGPGAAAAPSERDVPSGLVLGIGGGFQRFEQEILVTCGNAASCSGSRYKPALMGAVDFWMKSFLGAEVSYYLPMKVKASGSGNGYTFNSELGLESLNFVGKAGIPFRNARVYAMGGGTWHRAIRKTTETINPYDVTIDGATVTIPGGSQTLQMKTQGWGWLLGGGLEVWASRKWGLYVEGGRAVYQGKEVNGAEGLLDERVMYVYGGVKMHIGG